ncbi:MAG: hypothetical protein PUP91_00635 [Rhizonema sp. PD37]|nr:hypothetical protein [Rhizonema sp. PD37]
MTVICNATPLINFAAINHLDILEAVFGKIIIPQAVYDETTVSGFPGSEFVLQAVTYAIVKNSFSFQNSAQHTIRFR